jgi:molecular chaperone DnaK (HSP70)
MKHATEEKAIVVGIDFGTYGSTFAYGFTTDTTRRVVMGRPSDANALYPKELSMLLYKEGQSQPIAWGFEALRKFMDEDEKNSLTLVEKFKLHLLTNPHGDMPPHPITGRTFKVIDLVADFLRCLDVRIMEELRTVLGSPAQRETIRYVITIPTIWSEKTIQAMKTALFMAKIITSVNAPDNDCMFVLEPEAASVCAKNDQQSNGVQLGEGVVYMIIDAGGGTVDLTIHKITNNKLRELTVRSGGKCGSTFIDIRFFKWLEAQFNANKLQEYFATYQADKIDLGQSWENTKIGTKDFSTPRYVRPSPDFYQSLNQLSNNNKLFTKSRRLELKEAELKVIFEPVVNEVVQLVSLQLQLCSYHIDYIILVGGFSDSALLYSTIETLATTPHAVDQAAQNIPPLKVIRPPNGCCAVVKGAVYMGLDRAAISSRKSVYTYGIEVQEPWDETKHPESKLEIVNGMFLCKKVFFPFVFAGQEVSIII